ncbi:unnamed protein product, partial [Dicrocoelium dendriticum]
ICGTHSRPGYGCRWSLTHRLVPRYEAAVNPSERLGTHKSPSAVQITAPCHLTVTFVDILHSLENGPTALFRAIPVTVSFG